MLIYGALRFWFSIMVIFTSLRLLLSPMAMCDDVCESECGQSNVASVAVRDGSSTISATDRSAPQSPEQCPPDCQCLCTHHRSSALAASMLVLALPARLPVAASTSDAPASLADRGALQPPTPPPIG